MAVEVLPVRKEMPLVLISILLISISNSTSFPPVSSNLCLFIFPACYVVSQNFLPPLPLITVNSLRPTAVLLAFLLLSICRAVLLLVSVYRCGFRVYFYSLPRLTILTFRLLFEQPSRRHRSRHVRSTLITFRV